MSPSFLFLLLSLSWLWPLTSDFIVDFVFVCVCARAWRWLYSWRLSALVHAHVSILSLLSVFKKTQKSGKERKGCSTASQITTVSDSTSSDPFWLLDFVFQHSPSSSLRVRDSVSLHWVYWVDNRALRWPLTFGFKAAFPAMMGETEWRNSSQLCVTPEAKDGRSPWSKQEQNIFPCTIPRCTRNLGNVLQVLQMLSNVFYNMKRHERGPLRQKNTATERRKYLWDNIFMFFMRKCIFLNNN